MEAARLEREMKVFEAAADAAVKKIQEKESGNGNGGSKVTTSTAGKSVKKAKTSTTKPSTILTRRAFCGGSPKDSEVKQGRPKSKIQTDESWREGKATSSSSKNTGKVVSKSTTNIEAMTRTSCAVVDIMPTAAAASSSVVDIKPRPLASLANSNANTSSASMASVDGGVDRTDRDRALQAVVKASLRARNLSRRLRQTLTESEPEQEQSRMSATESDIQDLPDALANALTALLAMPPSKVERVN